MTRLRTASFVVLLVAVIAAQLAVVAPELWLTRVWEDEAYNLTVPLNLLSGHGYTSDGILTRFGGMTPFDVRISTGPTVLLPIAAMLATGVDAVVGSRLVMLLFYAGLLVVLWVLGRRVAGRWGGLVAIAVPLALNTNQLPSPSQGPIDVLGEFPSAMFLGLALLFVQRRPWLGGLMLGLAIQTKFITALALPVLVLMVWFAFAEVPTRQRIRRSLAVIVLAVVPSVLYQLVALVCLGWNAYVDNVHSFLYFLKTGGQYNVHTSALAKLSSLFGSWFVPAWLVLVVIVLALAVGAAVWALARRMPARARARLLAAAGACLPGRRLLVLLAGASLLLVVWIGWWAASKGTPDWVRYPAPGVLICVPMLAAAVVLGCRMLWLASADGTQARSVERGAVAGSVGRGAMAGSAERGEVAGSAERGAVAGSAERGEVRRSGQVANRALSIACAAVLALTLVLQMGIHVPSAYVPNLGETLAQQRAAAAGIAQLNRSRLASPWGGQIGAIVLAGSHVVSLYDPHRGDTPVVYAAFRGNPVAQLDRAQARSCGTTLLRLTHYLVCDPK
ncbi:MAG TPA: glycosyltransferase 87 family protein [Humibacter sp.]|nr:glycosyltransferase 87 family protein [Humibacter sp.]